MSELGANTLNYNRANLKQTKNTLQSPNPLNTSLPLMKNNIMLVGMPGAGKSTVGELIAKELGMTFFDVDDYIMECEGRSLQHIIDNEGLSFFKKLEEKYLSELKVEHTLISTGGSAIYSHKGISELKKIAFTVHLDVSLEEIKRRLGDFSTRGIVIADGMTFQDLFNERQPLYQAAADLTVCTNTLSVEEALEKVAKTVREDKNYSLINP